MQGDKDDNYSKADLKICLHLFTMPYYTLKYFMVFVTIESNGDNIIEDTDFIFLSLLNS